MFEVAHSNVPTGIAVKKFNRNYCSFSFISLVYNEREALFVRASGKVAAD